MQSELVYLVQIRQSGFQLLSLDRLVLLLWLSLIIFQI